MQLTDFKVLTFDCYGTLIDWESGIHAALQPLLRKAGSTLTRDQVLETFARHESDQEEKTPAMVYSQLLGVVHGRLAKEWGVAVTDEENARFGHSVPDWPAFPDSGAALAYLKQHYQLVILSNVDRESFKASNAKLGVAFDAIYTAQDIGSYKPNPANFEYMLAKLGERGVERGDILHTAQSLFHDHAQANRFKLASAWIDRRNSEGLGATSTPPKGVRYDFRFTSMAEMADAHRQASRASP